MHRRNFFHQLGAASTLVALNARGMGELSAESGSGLLRGFLQHIDQQVAHLLEIQELHAASPYEGGFPSAEGIYVAGPAAWNISELASAWVSPTSIYHRSPQVDSALNRAVEFLLRLQHDDGTIDLPTTNFHSPPDTAFAVEPLTMVLASLRRHAPKELSEFQQSTETFLQRAGAALVRGGVHTPNHRWVVCMALARIHELFPDESLIRRIDQWLAEGIDINSDGQYTERSTAIYSPLVNRCLITVARLLHREKLLEPVRANLNLTTYLVHPNGQVVTEGSRRQDRDTVAGLERYYYPYRYMAIHDQSGTYAAMARSIEETAGHAGLCNSVVYFLEDPLLLKDLPPSSELPRNYLKHFTRSGMVRVRRGPTDATILAGSPRFFTFHKGTAVLRAVRLATAFFGKGQFVSESLEESGGEFVLRQRLVGTYLQPLAPELLPGDGDWSKMPRASRTESEIQRLDAEIRVCESDGVFTLKFLIDGTRHVPVAIELGFDREGTLSGVNPVGEIDNAYLLDSQWGTYKAEGQTIQFGPGRAEHRATALRGSLPKLDAQCVYITDFTPFCFELTIR